MEGLPCSEDLYCEAVQSALSIPEPAEVVNSLLKIVCSLRESDHRDYARALLPKILDRILELNDHRERAYLLRLLVKEQCETGLREEAFKILPFLEFDKEYQDAARHDVALAQARAGLIVDALKTAEEIEDLDDYESVLEAVGERQSLLKLFPEAIRTAAKIEAGDPRSRLLRRIARDQWKADLHDEALQTLRSAQAVARGVAEESVRDRIFLDTVDAFTELHRVFDALSIAKEIGDPVLRIEAFCSMILFLQSSGNAFGGRTAADEATVAARKIADPFHRARALDRVGETLFRIGDTEEAKELFREALAAVKTIRNSYSQAQTMTELGGRMVAIGMPDVAKRVFRLAVALVQTIEGYSFQLLCFGRIVDAQVDAGLLIEADNTIALIEEVRETLSREERAEGTLDRDWAVALATVGAARCRHESKESVETGRRQFQRALDLARKIVDPLNRSTALYRSAERGAQSAAFSKHDD